MHASAMRAMCLVVPYVQSDDHDRWPPVVTVGGGRGSSGQRITSIGMIVANTIAIVIAITTITIHARSDRP